MTIPAAALARLDCESKVTHVGLQANRRTMLQRFDGADAVILGKLTTRPIEFEHVAKQAFELVAALKARGVKVIADFSDDNFAHPQVGPFHHSLANAVDALIASTTELANVLGAITSAPVAVVTDPVEGRRGEPYVHNKSGVMPRGPLRLLWYGHHRNLDTLQVGMPQLEGIASATPFSLVLISTPSKGAENIAAQATGAWRSRGSECLFRPWSNYAVFAALRECGAVIIPSNPHDPRKIVKSPNRFTEAIWAGRFVVAHPLPSYDALAEFGWVGENLADGLTWLEDHPHQAVERIRAGQAVIAERFTPATIAALWKNAVLKVLGR